jgi:transcription elongation factor GreA
MTGEGYQALDEELKRLKSVERPSVIAAISEARSHGDLSENAEYHAAKERQGWIEGRIAEIEDKMARAQVIDVSKLSGAQVKFGATVSVVDEDTEDEARYQIVGEHLRDQPPGPRHDRQGSRRSRRDQHSRRREVLRDPQGRVDLTAPRRRLLLWPSWRLAGRLWTSHGPG